MKRFLSGFLTFVLLLSFVTSIYLAGSGKHFSLRNYLNHIVECFQDLPSVEDLSDYWTKDQVSVYFPGNGAGGWIPVIFEDYDGDNDILEFFDSVRGFFKRAYYTLRWVALYVVGFFENVNAFLPWNSAATVEEVTT